MPPEEIAEGNGRSNSPEIPVIDVSREPGQRQPQTERGAGAGQDTKLPALPQFDLVTSTPTFSQTSESVLVKWAARLGVEHSYGGDERARSRPNMLVESAAVAMNAMASNPELSAQGVKRVIGDALKKDFKHSKLEFQNFAYDLMEAAENYMQKNPTASMEKLIAYASSPKREYVEDRAAALNFPLDQKRMTELLAPLHKSYTDAAMALSPEDQKQPDRVYEARVAQMKLQLLRDGEPVEKLRYLEPSERITRDMEKRLGDLAEQYHERIVDEAAAIVEEARKMHSEQVSVGDKNPALYDAGKEPVNLERAINTGRLVRAQHNLDVAEKLADGPEKASKLWQAHSERLQALIGLEHMQVDGKRSPALSRDVLVMKEQSEQYRQAEMNKAIGPLAEKILARLDLTMAANDKAVFQSAVRAAADQMRYRQDNRGNTPESFLLERLSSNLGYYNYGGYSGFSVRNEPGSRLESAIADKLLAAQSEIIKQAAEKGEFSLSPKASELLASGNLKQLDAYLRQTASVNERLSTIRVLEQAFAGETDPERQKALKLAADVAKAAHSFAEKPGHIETYSAEALDKASRAVNHVWQNKGRALIIAAAATVIGGAIYKGSQHFNPSVREPRAIPELTESPLH